MNQPGLSVDLPNEEMRWEVRRAALERRCTVRQLVVEILSRWLRENGYVAASTATDGERDDSSSDA